MEDQERCDQRRHSTTLKGTDSKPRSRPPAGHVIRRISTLDGTRHWDLLRLFQIRVDLKKYHLLSNVRHCTAAPEVAP